MEKKIRLYDNLGVPSKEAWAAVADTNRFVESLIEKYTDVDIIDLEHAVKEVISLGLTAERMRRDINKMELEKSTMVETSVE